MNILFAGGSLLAAAVLANLSTARARPQINARLGWAIVLLLSGCAAGALARLIGFAEAVAVCIAVLMALLPVVSLMLGVRHRKGGRRGA